MSEVFIKNMSVQCCCAKLIYLFGDLIVLQVHVVMVRGYVPLVLMLGLVMCYISTGYIFLSFLFFLSNVLSSPSSTVAW